MDKFANQLYIFYLAQSYFDRKEYERALSAYKMRTVMGGCNEEIFYSYYRMGKIMEILYPQYPYKAIDNYIKAWEVCKYRIESIWAYKKLWEKLGYKNFPQQFENILKTTPRPSNGLFIEYEKYEPA